MIKQLAMISVHASPLVPLGNDKAGGMNVYVRELAQELSKQGIRVDVYTRSTNQESEKFDRSLGENVTVIHVNAGPPRLLDPGDIYPYLEAFLQGVVDYAASRDVKYDFIYSHYWLSGWIAHRLRNLWQIPFAHIFHTLGHMKNRIGIRDEKTASPDIRTIVETQITRWADCVIAATPAEQAQLLWLYRADRQKIHVVSPGVNTGRFYPRPSNEAFERIAIPPGSRLVLFVGRIEPLKGIEVALRAVKDLIGQNPADRNNILFMVVGGDLEDVQSVELQRLRTLSVDLGLDDVVSFVGAKEQELLPHYYSAAIAVIIPSDYESFGMVALEAMACGAPVVASGVGGLAFLVQDSQTGFLVPVRDVQSFADRILLLMKNPEMRRVLSEQSIAYANHYSWTVIANQLLEVFEGTQEKSLVSASRRMN